ncbi:TadE family protein [Kitasatospora sp. NPDC092948]|uniref:TadE family protein n=1 Tax=Kitasatospora sp. NPDC092948 TaxID=3364088 RepID=UPI0038141B8C
MTHRPPRPVARAVLTVRRLRGRTLDVGAMSISLAIVFPAVLFVILLVVQAGLWWYADQAALTAAREGVDAGRVNGAHADDGPRRAQDFTDRLGDLARLESIRADSGDPDLYRLSVTVHPASVLPFFDRLTLTKTASAPREKFVPQGQP